MNFLNKVESGVQLFSRVQHRPPVEDILPELLPTGAPSQDHAIQIIGDSSTGKTTLLLNILARCALPDKYNEKHLPGKNAGAVFINTDHHFNLVRLMSIMEEMLSNFLESKETSDQLIKESLKKIVILNCYCSDQLKVTFMDLQTILSNNKSISVVVIDSLSAYYWADRYEWSLTNSFNSYCNNLLQYLKNHVGDTNIVLFYTKQDAEGILKANKCCSDFIIQMSKDGSVFNASVYQSKDMLKLKVQKYTIEKSICFLG